MMRLLQALSATVCVFVLSAAAVADDELAVRQVFDSYKSAILAGEGEAAASLLSAATIEYYTAMRDVALYSAETEVRDLSGMDMLMVLRLRDALPADRLQQMSGRDLLIYSVDQGWIGKESVESLSVMAVRVDGDNAVADMLTEHGPFPGGLEFRRESNVWKLDLLKAVQTGSGALDAMAREQGLNREQFVLSLLEQLNGTPVDSAIWQPPLQRP